MLDTGGGNTCKDKYMWINPFEETLSTLFLSCNKHLLLDCIILCWYSRFSGATYPFVQEFDIVAKYCSSRGKDGLYVLATTNVCLYFTAITLYCLEYLEQWVYCLRWVSGKLLNFRTFPYIVKNDLSRSYNYLTTMLEFFVSFIEF